MMKSSTTLLMIGLLSALIAGCVHNGDVSKRALAETYIHKYGLAVDKSDWQERGQHGQIVSDRKDGVHVVRTYANGKLHGDTTYSFPNSDIIARIELYEEDTLVAEQENYPSGTPKSERQYLLGSETLETHWYTSGSPRCRETYRGNLLMAAEYFSLENTLESRIESGEGLRIIRDAEGNLTSEDTINRGLMVRRTTFFPSGEPQSITAYVNDQEHGEKRTYEPGGIPSTIETWAQGELHGLTTEFVNGQKKAEIPYAHGRKHGEELRYSVGGDVAERVRWLRGVKHGSDQFLVDGDVQTDWYHHGQLVSQAIFDRLNPGNR